MTVDGKPIGGFVLGCIAGAFGGLFILSWAGWPVTMAAVGALLLGLLAPPRPFGTSGTLIGWGAAWLALVARPCGAGCVLPDLTGWVVAGAALALGGSLVGVRAARRQT